MGLGRLDGRGGSGASSVRAATYRRQGQPSRPSREEVSGPADKEGFNMTKPRTSPGIRPRTDANGTTRYQARVRRNGVTLTATLPSLREALAWQTQALEAADGKAEVPPSPRRPTRPSGPSGAAVTVEDAARRLVRGMVDGTARDKHGRDYKPSVTRKYERTLRRDVLPAIGAVPVQALRRGDVQRLVDELAATKSPEHARQALTALRVALRASERWGELDVQPCDRVTVPAGRDEPKRPRILDATDTARLLSAARADDEKKGRSFAYPFLVLLLGAGLRTGEALALRYGAEGLETAAGLVTVRGTLDRHRDDEGIYRELAPKSRTSRRTVPLSDADADALRAHREALGNPPDGALVFSTAAGSPLSAQGLPRDTFARVASAAGLVPKRESWRKRSAAKKEPAAAAQPVPAGPTLRLHDLRHTFATHALRAGLSAHAVARLLGHADAGLVWRRYGHALPDELALAGATLGAWREAAAKG